MANYKNVPSGLKSLNNKAYSKFRPVPKQTNKTRPKFRPIPKVKIKTREKFIPINKSQNNKIKSFYYSYVDYEDYACASEYAKNNGSTCSSCPSNYYSSTGKCGYIPKATYSSNRVCYAKNVILK